MEKLFCSILVISQVILIILKLIGFNIHWLIVFSPSIVFVGFVVYIVYVCVRLVKEDYKL